MVKLKFSKGNIVKNWKIRISKLSERSFLGTIGRKIQEKFQNLLAAIYRRSSVLKFSLPQEPM